MNHWKAPQFDENQLTTLVFGCNWTLEVCPATETSIQQQSNVHQKNNPKQRTVKLIHRF